MVEVRVRYQHGIGRSELRDWTDGDDSAQVRDPAPKHRVGQDLGPTGLDEHGRVPEKCDLWRREAGGLALRAHSWSQAGRRRAGNEVHRCPAERPAYLGDHAGAQHPR